MKQRLFAIIASLSLIGLSSGVSIFWLNNNCPDWSQDNCQFMWGTWGVAIIGGIFFLEYVYAHQWHRSSSLTTSENTTDNSNWYVTIRPVAWVVLSGLLLGMPLCAQGAYVLTLFGAITGIFLNRLVRGIFNWMPPEEDTIDT